jgi:hypothetical protein
MAAVMVALAAITATKMGIFELLSGMVAPWQAVYLDAPDIELHPRAWRHTILTR